jgi:phage terminase small subunit
VNDVAMDWELIRQEYETSNLTLKDLADKYGIKLGTLKSRKSRERWSRAGTSKKDATKKKKDATSKKDATMKPIIENEDLTEKQKLFCLYYLKYFNATKAYQKAYECDYFSAKAHGYKLLQNVAVKKAIESLKAEQQQELFLDAKDVLQKYIDIAFADITDFVEFGRKEEPEVNIITGDPIFDANGEPVVRGHNFVDFKNAEEVDGTIISEVKQGKEGISIKLADKMKALEMLTKYTELLPESQKRRLEEEKLKVEVEKLKNGDDDKPIEIMIKRKNSR